jgi:hypothetical protein
LLQYPRANSTENKPIEGKNENGLFACLKMLPTVDGSKLDTVVTILAYFFDIGYAVCGETILFLFIYFFNKCVRLLKYIYIFKRQKIKIKWQIKF